jgi:hypothetical protein
MPTKGIHGRGNYGWPGCYGGSESTGSRWYMPSLFYKKYWDIVGDDVIREVLHFLNEGVMPERCM